MKSPFSLKLLIYCSKWYLSIFIMNIWRITVGIDSILSDWPVKIHILWEDRISRIFLCPSTQESVSNIFYYGLVGEVDVLNMIHRTGESSSYMAEGGLQCNTLLGSSLAFLIWLRWRFILDITGQLWTYPCVTNLKSI